MSDIGTETFKLKKDEILFVAGENNSDLYIIRSGKVMVYVQNGSQITPVAYLERGEYIGELSFFDGTPRSASIVCLEPTEFIKIPTEELHRHIPPWLLTMGLELTKKIRANDELIRSRGIRKTKVESIKPLTIEEQTKYYKLTEAFKK